MSRARLIRTRSPRKAKAAVIVLHGGGGRRGNMMVRPTQLSVLRMIPIAWRIALRGRGKVAVFRLLNSSRGWDVQHTPVDDAQWAIAEVREQLGRELPVGLVGHSLGGRAALLAATDPAVTTVVALNPYLYTSDGHTDLSGTDVLIVHGTADRVASPHVAGRVAELLRSRTPVTLSWVEGGKHAMLSQYRRFDAAAADFVISHLLASRITSSSTRRADDPSGYQG